LKTCPQPSPVFTGRGNVITSMTEHFAEDLGKRHIYVLYGLGGAGKSQIAYKFVQTSQTEPKGSRFSEVFFVDATSPETIRTDMENIARVKCEGGETVEDALRWLADEKKEWLILFNNADDTSLNLSQYFPQCAHGNILITTRNPQLRRYAPKANHQVADMEPDEAKDLLIRIVDPPSKGPSHTNGDQALSLELGFFALAIVQAGAYIANTNISIDEYLKLYARCRGELLEEYKDQVQKVDDYEWTVYTTWIISFQRLSKEAAKFLQLCAFLHHDGISESIFEKGATQLASYHPALQDEAQHFEDARQFIDHFKSNRGDWDPLKFRKTVSEVQSYSLIDYDAPNQVYFIHPLVWEWTRTKMVSNTKVTCTTMQCILGMSVSSELKMEDFAFRRGLVRHIDSALADGKVTGSDIAERFGRVLGEAGRWDDAEALEDPVVGFRKESLGMDHPDTLTSIANLATIYLNQKRLEEAQELELIVMEGRRKVLGVNDPKTLAAMNNLASIYSRQGRWKEAKALHVEVLGTKRQVLGERHPSTLTSMSNLAWIYCKQGQLDEAEKLQSFVLESRTEEFGEQHPSTLAAMGHLATTLKKKGRAEDAGALE
ncbi:TPR-like protein, partial [Sistotremastrum niveocremeum HHB9708]